MLGLIQARRNNEGKRKLLRTREAVKARSSIAVARGLSVKKLSWEEMEIRMVSPLRTRVQGLDMQGTCGASSTSGDITILCWGSSSSGTTILVMSSEMGTVS
jgi:hypothetical protein